MKVRSATDTEFWFGVSKHAIDPPPGLRLMGYPVERPCAGIESNLHIRAAVFGAGPNRAGAALVMIDNLYAPAPIVAAIRRRAAEQIRGLKPESIMVGATHTHSAPALHPYHSADENEGLVRPDRAYCRRVVDAAVASLAEAWEQRRAVVARLGKAQATLGHNRRAVVNGNALNEWQDPRGKHTGYFNSDIPFVVFLDSRTKSIHSILAAYGCHPVTLGPGSCSVSPDYPGHFARQLEKDSGADAVIFFSSGAGDINPRKCLRNGPQQARRMGRALAKAVAGSIAQAQPVRLAPATSSLASLRFSARENAGRWAEAQLRGRITGGIVRTEVQTIHMGDLKLVSAPGELFSEIATRVRAASPAVGTFVVEHANDAVGYIFTDAAAREGGYEVCRASISESMERPYLAAVRKALGTVASSKPNPG